MPEINHGQAATPARVAITRRRALQALGGGTAAALLTVTRGSDDARLRVESSRRAWSTQTGPDIYVVTVDDCPTDYIGYYQQRLPTAYEGPIFTPELDEILAQSWVATSARATEAECPSSRSSFLSAAGPDRTGVHGGAGLLVTSALRRFVEKVDRSELVALPGYLTARGFDTATRGKVDHDRQLFDLSGQIVENGIYTKISTLLNDPAYAPSGPFGSDASGMALGTLPPAVEHVDALRVDEQIARINAPYAGQRVDFLGLFLPHTPRSIHQRWLDRYDLADVALRTTPEEVAADLADIPDTNLAYLERPYLFGVPRGQWMFENLTEDALKQHVRHMLASVSHSSFQIGRLKSALDAVGRPYVMILTSDHGYHLGEKGHYGKGTLYDKALRVPLAVYSSEPNNAYPTGDADHPVSLLGLPKTVVELAGVPDSELPAQWEGNRFGDQAGNCTRHSWGPDPAAKSTALVFKTKQGRTFKFISHPGDDGEVYNLTDDPAEFHNLAAPAPESSADQQRAAQIQEADAELGLRARKERAREWKERDGRLSDPRYS